MKLSNYLPKYNPYILRSDWLAVAILIATIVLVVAACLTAPGMCGETP